MPKLYIISGCNGSGKTTASYTLLPDLLNCREFVNSDEFAKSLSPFDPGAASVTASRYMLMKINYLLDKRADFAVETTLATRSLLKIVQQAQGLGYEATLLYLWLNSPELAIQRVRERVRTGGHNIPEAVVRRRYVMGLQYFFEAYLPVIDRWILADNSKPPFAIVAEGSKQVSYIKDSEKYRLIWNIAHPDDEL
ncbi:MAG: zeta toxin family protein [Bacteroidales bacterium]|nr:zeta toxin family protein [Bacteroidales bacterium]